MKQLTLSLAVCMVAGWAQQPVISPGGVVSGASYTTGIGQLTDYYPQTGGGPTLMSGSIATIFGSNLAASTLSAQPPLPIKLGGATVSVNGIAAPLFFVSPTQIDFQVPSMTGVTVGAEASTVIVVSNADGQSSPYPLPTNGAFGAPGIFTQDSSGCGRGAVLNVAPDGAVSLNSSTNSAAPGAYISIFGTGNGYVYNSPPDGEPAPTSPLASSDGGWTPVFDFSNVTSSGAYWAGRAPGLVGVDQFNLTVPATVRQGCAVPLQIENENLSVPVTISIAAAAGPCTDPPSQGYGQALWQKTVTTSALGMVTETDTVTLSLEASPGRQAPVAPVFAEGATTPVSLTYYGSQCSIPGYRSLDAGAVTAQGPGLKPAATSKVPLTAGTEINLVPPVDANYAEIEPTQASGITAYQATLPAGAIQPGAFALSASGGADVAAFQTTVQIGSPIQVVTALAARVLDENPLLIQWTGGDANSWVTLKLLSHAGPYDWFHSEWVARASDGRMTIQALPPPYGFGVAGAVDIVIEVVPDPATVPAIVAPGLTLGGRALWKYKYVFQGATTPVF